MSGHTQARPNREKALIKRVESLDIDADSGHERGRVSPVLRPRAYVPQEPVPLDRTILLRFRAGDASAFAQVMPEFDSLVRSVVRRHWQSEFQREEAMQEVWTHAYRQRDALDPARLDAFAGWLAVLAKRRCLDLSRSPEPAPTDAQAEALLAELAAEEDPHGDVEARELSEAVRQFIAGLRPGWREFFELHFVQGQDYEAVGARLGIGKLRCKYMKKVLALQARHDARLRAALGRLRGGAHGDRR